MAVGRGVAQEDRRERVIGQLGDGLFGLDLGLGVGGQRVERVALVEVELLALAVDRAAPGEQVARNAGLLGDLGQADRGVAIDVEGELGVERAHRVVGDGRQVHHAVAAVEVGGLDLARTSLTSSRSGLTMGSQLQPSKRLRSQPMTVWPSCLSRSTRWVPM